MNVRFDSNIRTVQDRRYPVNGQCVGSSRSSMGSFYFSFFFDVANGSWKKAVVEKIGSGLESCWDSLSLRSSSNRVCLLVHEFII